MDVLDALANAPLCAVSKRWPRTIHAAPLDQVRCAVRGRTMSAPCGVDRLRLLVLEGVALLWPPGPQASPLKRCRPCWELTGRPRPRPRRSLFVRRP